MTIITKPLDQKSEKDEKAFLNDFEGPPNVTVTMPADAEAANGGQSREDDTDSVSVRQHHRMGGFRFFFLVVLVITALTSAMCFFKAMHVVRYKRGLCSLPFNLRYFDDTTLISGRFSDSGRIEVARHNQLEPDSLVTKVKETIHEEVEESADGSGLIFKWEMDEEVDSYEMTELPQLSRGKYIHDFKMNKTLILDDENDRCFIMELNRNEIKPPRDFMEFISRLENGIYQLNLNEVRHDTRVVFPPLDNVSWLKYGVPIANNCQKRTSYLLEEVEKILEKRSASEVPAPSKFIEFGGDSFITYNIVNLKEV